MTKNSKIYLASIVLVAVAVGAGVFLIMKNRNPQTLLLQTNQQKNIVPPELSPATAKAYSGQGFSFSYPPEMNIGNIPDDNGNGRTILVQDPKSGASVQIYISPFDENAPITPERIKSDLPGQTVNNPKQVTVGGAGALSFESDDAGQTHEVWFNHNGSLYQITTYSQLSDFLNKILATWKFQ